MVGCEHWLERARIPACFDEREMLPTPARRADFSTPKGRCRGTCLRTSAALVVLIIAAHVYLRTQSPPQPPADNDVGPSGGWEKVAGPNGRMFKQWRGIGASAQEPLVQGGSFVTGSVTVLTTDGVHGALAAYGLRQPAGTVLSNTPSVRRLHNVRANYSRRISRDAERVHDLRRQGPSNPNAGGLPDGTSLR